MLATRHVAVLLTARKIHRRALLVLTAAPEYKCPAAPYEAAMLLERACRRREIRDSSQNDRFVAEPGPMGVAGPEMSKAVRELAEGKGVGDHLSISDRGDGEGNADEKAVVFALAL